MVYLARPDARLRTRLRGYLLIGAWLALVAVAAHRWVPETWRQSIATAITLSVGWVIWLELRAWKYRRRPGQGLEP
jgi:hypothetical protein